MEGPLLIFYSGYRKKGGYMNYASFALGAAAGMVAPKILSFGATVMKETTKAGIKGGLLVYGYGKRTVNGAVEAIGNVAAEAKEEMQSEPHPVQKKKTPTSKSRK
jgi:hypothetical protein